VILSSDLLGESGFVSLVRTDAGYAKGISVRALMGRYSLTRLSTYQHQSRHAINMQRMTAAPNVAAWKYNRDGHPNPTTMSVEEHHTDDVSELPRAEVATAEHDLRKLSVAAPDGGWSREAEHSVLVNSSDFVRAKGSLAGMRGAG
jgi:hypothetical protein